jgi:hypothetical protein
MLQGKGRQTWHESFPRTDQYFHELFSDKQDGRGETDFPSTMSPVSNPYPSKEFRCIPNASTIPRAILADTYRSSIRDRILEFHFSTGILRLCLPAQRRRASFPNRRPGTAPYRLNR